MTALARVQPGSALDVLREQLAPGCPDSELVYFAEVAKRLDLDPLKGEINCIPRWDSRVNRKVYRPEVTVQGRRTMAQRTGEMVGIEGPVWCGPRDQHDGQLVWQEVWDDDDQPPYCARVLVYRKGWVKPANGTAKWSEFAQWVKPKQGAPYLAPQWQQMPSHMLGKVAESLALRRAFAEVEVAVETAGADMPDVDYQPPDPSEPPRAIEAAVGLNDQEYEHVVPDRDQKAELNRMFDEAGLGGRANVAGRKMYASEILGREIGGADELSRGDIAQIIEALKADAAAQPEPVEGPVVVDVPTSDSLL